MNQQHESALALVFLIMWGLASVVVIICAIGMLGDPHRRGLGFPLLVGGLGFASAAAWLMTLGPVMAG